jgi:class 3 adenylate cyclase
MPTRTLRRLHYRPTGDLRNRGTRQFAGTTVLRDPRSTEQLQVQADRLLTEIKILTARLAAVSDVAVAVNSSLRPDDILDVIVHKVRHALGFDYCAIGLMRDHGDEYSVRPLVWPEGTVRSKGEQTFGVTDGLPGTVMSNGKPLIVDDLTERPLKVRPAHFLGTLHPELEGTMTAAGLHSVLALPLIVSGEVLGCLMFAKCEADYYDQDDLQLAYLLAMLLAAALHNSRLFDAESRRSHQLQMLSEVGQTATSILDPAALLSQIPPVIQANFHYDVAKIGMLEEDEVVYVSSAQFISGCPHPEDMRLVVARNGMPLGIVGLSVYTGQMVLVRNVFEDARWADVADSLSGPHIRSVLVIPMAARDRVLGVLHFESERADAFSAADVSILNSLANQLGVALDNARLYQQLNELFHGYIAPQVASTLLDNPMNAQLGGQRRMVTVLFADLDGFTGLSEQVPPEELLELLNACLGAATEAIQECGGTIDKYMGDAVMALFNAPQDQPDHAWRAMRAAVSMQRKLRALTGTWEHKMRFSIGLNSGEAVVGNIGSESLRNYTAIGDTVNLAKRIQEAAAPGQVLVSESTHEAAVTSAAHADGMTGGDDNIVSHCLGTVEIKGRSKPAVLYEISPYTAPLSLPEKRKVFRNGGTRLLASE